jgi:ABC-type multidrug transport system ATPase subunit
MPLPAISFRQITKRYRDAAVLSGVTFEVARGECFALAGINGAGKTTLIKCLLDFCHLDKGEIEIMGVRHLDTQARANLAYLPERFNPPYYLSSAEFLDYMAKLHGVPLDVRRVKTMLQALDLEASALDKPVRQLSKGMTQKLGLASCLLTERQLYILDEPLSGLDPRARALVKRQLQILRAEGRTLFFTSHALADIQELCDRMAVLHEGSLRFIGTAQALVHGYGVADFEQAFLRCIG